jgi:hypothetical protein
MAVPGIEGISVSASVKSCLEVRRDAAMTTQQDKHSNEKLHSPNLFRVNPTNGDAGHMI